MIQIKGQYEFTDFKNAQTLHAQYGKLTTWVGYFAVGILALGTLTGIVLAVLGRFSWSDVTYFTFPAIFIVILALFQFVILPRQMLRVFKQQKDLSYPFEIDLSDDGFEMRNEYGSSRVPWGDFAKWKEDANLLLLYRSDAVFQMLPKRLFQDNQELEFVHEKLRQANVPDARRVRNPVQMITFALLLLVIIVICITSYISNLPKP